MSRGLEKRAFLTELGVDRFDLSALSPNRRAWLAQTGRQQTNQALARLASERRYPVLAAFCVEALERVTDDAIEVFDRALGSAGRAAQRKRDELDRRGRRDTQTTVRRFIELSGAVLEAHDAGCRRSRQSVWCAQPCNVVPVPSHGSCSRTSRPSAVRQASVSRPSTGPASVARSAARDESGPGSRPRRCAYNGGRVATILRVADCCCSDVASLLQTRGQVVNTGAKPGADPTRAHAARAGQRAGGR